MIERIANFLGYERRDVSSRDPYLAEMMLGRDTSSGQMVTPEKATGIAAVHACVQLIAETIASLPLAPYRKLPDGGREVDPEHPLTQLLKLKSNRVQTAMEFREQLLASCLLTGNGYALKVMNGRGEITELAPLHPEQVQPVKLVNGRVRYDVMTDKGSQRYIQDEILHIRYRSRDGFTGLSPITIARETIGVALAQQQYEGAAFKNGLRPGGYLQYPQRLSPEQTKAIQGSLKEAYGGASNAGKLMVLEQGLEFKPISLNHHDAQFVETRKLTLDDIARIFRIPPPSIGILSDATYSNITEQSRMLVMHTLRPWLIRIEQAMNSSLLTEEGRRTHFIEHNAEGLLRGNQKERYESYRIGREWGWLSSNEIRNQENMGGLGETGDTYRQPMNSEELGGEASGSSEAT